MIGVISEEALYPLCVDLDGTLVSTDTLAELLLLTIRRDPLSVCRVPFWLARGKACCKRELAIRSALVPDFLPYNQKVVNFIQAAKASGQKVLLVTGADQGVADRIATHLNLFDEVIASGPSDNLVGRRKRNEMEKRFGAAHFDYIGNSSADLPVWSKARRVFVVASEKSFASFQRQLRKEGVEITSHVSQIPSAGPGLIARALHIPEWGRNLLLFAPLILAPHLSVVPDIAKAALGFLSFGLMTSGACVIGDLLHLDEDRQSAGKRFTPFASGELSIWLGLFLGPLLAGSSLAIGLLLSPAFGFLLIALAVTTFLNSRYSKCFVIVDVTTRACLYLLALFAGSILAGTGFSTQALGLLLVFLLSFSTAERFASTACES